MRWPIFTLLFLFSAIGHAQTENIDSVYRLFNQKLVIGNDSVLLSWIQQHHLNLNHRFQMPDRFYNYNALHKTPDYYSHSKPTNIIGAFAELLITPFKSLAGAADALKGRGGSAKADSAGTKPKIPLEPPTTLLNEMLQKDYYGWQGCVFNALLKNEPLDTSGFLTKDRAKLIVQLALYHEDTTTLNFLEKQGWYHPDSVFSLYYWKLNRPILVAAYFQKPVLLHYLFERNVNPLVKCEYGTTLFYGFYKPASGFHFYNALPARIRDKQLTPAQLCMDKGFRQPISDYTKAYKKSLKKKR
jgi:hypothetical protein